ncbi:hypothetical protein AWRIB429_0635 [Oenococcus oeni AWRIB429]|uniref:Uncharacterized protein n=1 Tax=Oenococcus oeni AWRIB429 TaxID=655225 RepID=D3L8F5_OENOE|nr:hypothetical protein AWRIB429_0635 [Oenococcus oeni AWRIB429]KZD13284.1 hypothetical protein AC229_0333 [Oenococcus oeni]
MVCTDGFKIKKQLQIEQKHLKDRKTKKLPNPWLFPGSLVTLNLYI